MKLILILIIILVFNACSYKQFVAFNYEQAENPWIDAFKDRVFFTSLRSAYKSDTLFRYLEKKDAFNPFDGLSADAESIADSLGKKLMRNIPPPKMCEGCKGDQNYYMATALHYYKSVELDAIARSEFKKHIKQEKAAITNL